MSSLAHVTAQDIAKELKPEVRKWLINSLHNGGTGCRRSVNHKFQIRALLYHLFPKEGEQALTWPEATRTAANEECKCNPRQKCNCQKEHRTSLRTTWAKAHAYAWLKNRAEKQATTSDPWFSSCAIYVARHIFLPFTTVAK